MGYLYMILVGVVLGWQAAFVLRAESTRDTTRFIGVGVAGSLVSGILLTPTLSEGNLISGTYTVDALLITMAGAVAALAACHLLHTRGFFEPGLERR
ncbi:hypothetical protein GCM10023208_19900 [Erythrobacter westpacificensis]|uniref:GlsB/YeaQ/YmgE family stress response membrane protein n=1 Tax=Erythrobacter westpacificensis TaxID=1055231 RepID=A0ABP9KC25_9SPHN